MTAREVLLRQIGYNWISMRDLVNRNYPEGWIGETSGAKRLREITEPGHRNYDPTIEKKTINGLIHYRKISAGDLEELGRGLQPITEPGSNVSTGTIPKQLNLI